MSSGRVPSVWAPAADAAAVDATAQEIEAAGVAVEHGRPLGPFTTFGIGGPGRAFVQPADRRELALVLTAVGRSPASAVPLLVLGRGSNMLVSDEGFPGVVVRLGAGFKTLRRDGLVVEAGGGEAMPALAAWLAKESLSGLEFAAGIPASVGGSVRMNAGAHGGDVAGHLLSVDVMSAEHPDAVTMQPAELGFGYRRSSLPERSVVVAARWLLTPDDPAAIRARLDDLRAWRRRTQPLRERNCGSVFTNPDGDSAGRLVESVGGKGMRVGGARVSEKHANFIVVEPGTTAADVWRLITAVRDAVAAAGGPVLNPEVRLVGVFPS